MRERYDNGAWLYARYWAPVLHRSALGVVERLAEDGSRPARIVDLGTGTGALALGAARRFPDSTILGIDFSRGMLAVARTMADEASEPSAPGVGERRLEWLEADAARLPVADRSVDAVVSSFVLQLVPRRAPVYREVLRILRPGGRFVFVTWCVDKSPFAPSEAFEDSLDELEIAVDEGPPEKVAGDFASVRATADSLRRAGFEAARAEAGTLEYEFTPQSYLEYKLRYDDRALVEGLRASVRRRLEGRFREKLARLPTEDFILRAPIVYAAARRPPGAG